MADKLQLSLAAGRVIRVAGPARLRPRMGQVMVLGAVFNPGDEAFVHEARSYAVKALDDSVLDLELWPGASVEAPKPGEEPLDRWVAVVDDLLRRGCSGFMVLGPVDSGKSSLTALIANRALLRGKRVAVIDADIGQADVGPPAFVSAAFVERRILWLRELKPWKMRFVGYITPQRGERRIAAAVAELSGLLRMNGADVVVVDTDGWVQGVNSIEYKVEAVRYAHLDAAIVVGDETLARMVEAPLRGLSCGVHLLPTPGVKRVRNREDRRGLRMVRYRDFLEPGRQLDLDLSRLMIQGSCFFSGVMLPGETVAGIADVLGVRVEAASETYDTIYVVTEGQPSPAAVERLSAAMNKHVYVLDKRNMPGALLALLDERLEERAPGLLLDTDFRALRARVLTSYQGGVRGIIVGGTRLGQDYAEVGRPLRCII